MKNWKPYLTVLRLRALLETQYRGAALGGLVTQAFFALVYVFLYMALYGEGDPQGLSATITYVWIQQMLFRLLFSTDGEVARLILDGGVAYMLVRPVDQHRFWVCRDLGGRLVAAAMRLWPMLLFQLILLIATRNNLSIHDILANTIAVDYASQRIFDSTEALVEYKKKLHAEEAEKQPY
jgi:ABC-type uncharacterized transport system permease subunit